MSWEDTLKATPTEITKLLNSVKQNMLTIKDELDFFYSMDESNPDTEFKNILNEVDKKFESFADSLYDMIKYKYKLEEREKHMQERLQ